MLYSQCYVRNADITPNNVIKHIQEPFKKTSMIELFAEFINE